MNPSIAASLALFTALLFSAIATANESVDPMHVMIEQGRDMHAEDCVRCHSSQLYTSPKRKVNNYDALKKQVYNCNIAIGLNYFDEDVESLSHYMNSEYYKFPAR
jgi:cytochrome c553